MKKIIFLLVCLSFLFIGCSAKNDQELQSMKNELLENIQKAMPEKVYNELKENGHLSSDEDNGEYIYLFGNKEQDPTLRLDFVYKDKTLIQYRSKEYGFVDEMEDTVISKNDAIKLTQTFAKVFLDKDVSLSETSPYSGYEDENYVTFKDTENNTYLVQLNRNMVIKFDIA